MEQSLTITLPADVRQALDDFAREEGMLPEVVVEEAVKEHLFLRRFRLLQERMSENARKQGVLTDQDVFDRVS
jgi:predicted transcriptional regulator